MAPGRRIGQRIAVCAKLSSPIATLCKVSSPSSHAGPAVGLERRGEIATWARTDSSGLRSAHCASVRAGVSSRGQQCIRGIPSAFWPGRYSIGLSPRSDYSYPTCFMSIPSRVMDSLPIFGGEFGAQVKFILRGRPDRGTVQHPKVTLVIRSPMMDTPLVVTKTSRKRRLRPSRKMVMVIQAPA
jgi:hypothetical protein